MDLTLANIQNTARREDYAAAEKLLVKFLSELFGLAIISVEIRRDALSLNSVNGYVNLAEADLKTGARQLFFKFHHEEGEEGLAEYYNSLLLSENGYPVEMPVYVSQEVGRQVLLYPVKTAERMADVCKRLDFGGDFGEVMAAQVELDRLSCAKYLETLHNAGAEKVRDEPIMQLFYNRLVDGKRGSELGGRYQQFYAEKDCELPCGVMNFEELKKLRWEINGVTYERSLVEAFERSLQVLAPDAQEIFSAVIAHGDAHNGNVWFNDGAYLTLFDPAFAGRDIPALLAEIKATFHNIFAHPLWLYDSRDADGKYSAECEIDGGLIRVKFDWRLSELRAEFLKSKLENLWVPLLRELRAQGKLQENWQEYMRLALFCCPTLVMNLRAKAGSEQNSHTAKTSLIGFAVAIMLSSPPSNGKDVVSEFFAALEAGL